MTAGDSTKGWGIFLPFLIGVGLALPVFEQVQKALQPNLGTLSAFAIAVLASLVIAFPPYFAMYWVIQREQRGVTDGLAPMVYRPAALPVWVFLGACIKNFPEAITEYITWTYVVWLLTFLAGAVALQRRRGRAWSWWVAVPVSMIIALIALPAAGFVVWMVAPDEMRPG